MKLDKHIIQRLRRGALPPPTITAPYPMAGFSSDPVDVCKALSDNRDRYIEQSKNTRFGIVAPLPARSRS